jgi:hypothetical protein
MQKADTQATVITWMTAVGARTSVPTFAITDPATLTLWLARTCVSALQTCATCVAATPIVTVMFARAFLVTKAVQVVTAILAAMPIIRTLAAQILTTARWNWNLVITEAYALTQEWVHTCACAPGFDGERCQIELCQTKVYTQAGGQLTYPTAGDNTYDCDVLCLGDYSWTRNFNQNLNQNSPILIHDAFDVDGDTHFLKSITVSASNAQICVSPKTGVIAPRPSLGAPFLAKVNAVTVGEFEDESNVLRTENGCQCYEYADFDCREYVYTPVDDLCLAYTFNGDNTLTVDGLVYNTVNSITVAVEVCQGSNPLSCP